MIKTEIAESVKPEGIELREIMADLPKHVWDSSAEPPKDKLAQYHPLARKAVKVKRRKKQ